jgi:hypothetical protein
MLFSRPDPPLSKITAPTAAEICAKSKPSPEGKALLQPGMTPSQYQGALEKNKLSVDSVNFLAHGMEPKDSVCWACQASRMTAPKLSGPEMSALNATECWLKNPTAGARSSMAACLGKVDYTGPASWATQAALWAPILGLAVTPAGAGLTGSAVAGAIMLAAGLKGGPAMPAVPNPKLQLPTGPPTPAMLLALAAPKVPAQPDIPVVDQPQLMKTLSPFIDLGKAVANGKVTCT